MACCPNGNECNHIITLGYLREFIGDNIKDSNGNVKHVTTTKGDEYCPTYSDLTGGTLIPNFVDAGSGKWSLNVDGITVNGSYSSGQCVMQKDLVLTYTEFESLTITATPSTNIDSCSGTSTLSYTYKLRKTVKSMDDSCNVGESSTTNNDTTNVITYSSNQSWATISKPTVTMSKNNPNNNGRSNNRTVTITGEITYKGATKSATATITQNGLTGSYRFWYTDYYVHDRGVSCIGSTFGCEGGNYGATAYYYQDDWNVYRWQDKCGTNYNSDTQERDRVNNTYHEYDSYSNSFPNNTETGGPAKTDSKSWPGYGSCSWSQSYCPPPDCPTCETSPEDCNKTVYGYGTYTGTVPCTGGTVYMSNIVIPGTSYTYSYDEEASACTVTTAATSTRQSRNIYIDCNTGNAKTHTGTIGNINYTITQPAGPCCTPNTSITYTDIVIPCDAAVGVVGESTKTVRTTGECCNQSSSTSRVRVVIGDVECNSGDTREITGIPHEGDFKIYQEGRANCCCTCDTAEFNVTGASISRNIPANGYSTPVVIGTYNASTCLTGITANSSVNWITIASVSNGNVNATISQNTSLTDDRNGNILVSGRDKDGKPCSGTFPVVQIKSASTCTCESVDIGAASAGVIPAAGYSVATLIGTYDGATCLTDVTASSNVDWITITSTANGSINGTVSQNTSLSDDKSGTITVYSKDAYGNTCPYDFVVIQSKSASTCTCENVNINAASAGVIPAEGYSVPTLIGTYDGSICLTDITATTSDNWITITSVSDGNINATVLQNESVDNDKVGVITVSGKDAYGTTCKSIFPVTQAKNTCQDPTTVYSYTPIELPCDAAASFMTAITYSAVTSYSNCEPTTETGINTITVPSVTCNKEGVKTIQEGRTGATLADAVPQITQIGRADCCPCLDPTIIYTYEDVLLSCESGNSFVTAVTYSAVTSYSNCEPTTETGTTMITIPSVVCNNGDDIVIQNGKSSTVLSEALPKISQAGHCICGCDEGVVWEISPATIPCDEIESGGRFNTSFKKTTTWFNAADNICETTVVNYNGVHLWNDPPAPPIPANTGTEPITFELPVYTDGTNFWDNPDVIPGIEYIGQCVVTQLPCTTGCNPGTDNAEKPTDLEPFHLECSEEGLTSDLYLGYSVPNPAEQEKHVYGRTISQDEGIIKNVQSYVEAAFLGGDRLPSNIPFTNWRDYITFLDGDGIYEEAGIVNSYGAKGNKHNDTGQNIWIKIKHEQIETSGIRPDSDVCSSWYSWLQYQPCAQVEYFVYSNVIGAVVEFYCADDGSQVYYGSEIIGSNERCKKAIGYHNVRVVISKDGCTFSQSQAILTNLNNTVRLDGDCYTPPTYYTFTVRSNVEGANVVFKDLSGNNLGEGTITNGVLQISLTEEQVMATISKDGCTFTPSSTVIYPDIDANMNGDCYTPPTYCSYTVSSNVEGAIVSFYNGDSLVANGSIINGVCQVELPYEQITATIAKDGCKFSPDRTEMACGASIYMGGDCYQPEPCSVSVNITTDRLSYSRHLNESIGTFELGGSCAGSQPNIECIGGDCFLDVSPRSNNIVIICDLNSSLSENVGYYRLSVDGAYQDFIITQEGITPPSVSPSRFEVDYAGGMNTFRITWSAVDEWGAPTAIADSEFISLTPTTDYIDVVCDYDAVGSEATIYVEFTIPDKYTTAIKVVWI